MTSLGFWIVYVAAFYTLLVLWWSARAVRWPSPGPASRFEQLVGVLLSALAVSLFTPWIEGWTPKGDFVVHSAWIALDPFSTGAVAVLAFVYVGLLGSGRGGPERRWLLAALSVCAVALIAGNVVIQGTTERGSDLRWGAYTSATLAGFTALGGAAIAWPRRISSAPR